MRKVQLDAEKDQQMIDERDHQGNANVKGFAVKESNDNVEEQINQRHPEQQGYQHAICMYTACKSAAEYDGQVNAGQFHWGTRPRFCTASRARCIQQIRQVLANDKYAMVWIFSRLEQCGLSPG